MVSSQAGGRCLLLCPKRMPVLSRQVGRGKVGCAIKSRFQRCLLWRITSDFRRYYAPVLVSRHVTRSRRHGYRASDFDWMREVEILNCRHLKLRIHRVKKNTLQYILQWSRIYYRILIPRWSWDLPAQHCKIFCWINFESWRTYIRFCCCDELRELCV